MKVEINEIEIKCKIELEERGNRMLWDESDDDEDEEEFGFIGKFIQQFFKKFLTQDVKLLICKLGKVADLSLKLDDQKEIMELEIVNANVRNHWQRWRHDSDSSSDGYVDNDCGLM